MVDCFGAGHSLVSDIIDFEQGEDGMMISYGVCDQLDEMKHTYHGLPDFLTKVTHPLPIYTSLNPNPLRPLLHTSDCDIQALIPTVLGP